ncbi:MAG: hypothetical protein PHU85_02310 [Phycisphaerae bacterium]|nr:hypothetical protein [Phycisphaerae bacterium]
MTTYYGSAILAGPVGAKDTPEQFLPIMASGAPTETAIVITADSAEAARDKQILWHLVRNRIAELRRQRVCVEYAETRDEVLKRLEVLADRVIR